MDIFDLDVAIRPIAEKVMHQSEAVSFSYGNEGALILWLGAMNGKQIEKALKRKGARKYPLIWLGEGWEGNKQIPGYKFTGVSFYISLNSDVKTLNENREVNFETLFKIANDFIAEMKRSKIRIAQESIQWTKRANFTSKDKSHATDIWDTIMLTMDFIANTDCFKHIKK